MGLKIDPQSFMFGATLTVAALIIAYVLLRLVMKPASRRQAVKIAMIWAMIALVLDILTAKPIVMVPVAVLLSQVQAWTRLLAIVVAACLTPAQSYTPKTE